MAIKKLIEEINNSKETPLNSIEKLVFVMESSSSEVFEAFNKLNFEKQCDFIEKIFEGLPESYLLVAQFLAHQDKISDEGVRYQLNDIAEQKSSKRLKAFARLSEKLKDRKEELGNAVLDIIQSLQSPVTLKQHIVQLEKKLASLRKKRIEQSAELFAIKDLEEQIAKIQGELDQLTSHNFVERESHLRRLQEQVDAKKRELEGETAHLKAKAQVALAEINKFNTLLAQVKNFGSRLDNVPKETEQSLLNEIEEIKILLDDENENGLKNRILRISGQLQTIDEVEKIMGCQRISETD